MARVPEAQRFIFSKDNPDYPTHRWCYKCGCYHPMDDFYNSKNGQYGKGTQCKKTQLEAKIGYYQENKETKKADTRKRWNALTLEEKRARGSKSNKRRLERAAEIEKKLAEDPDFELPKEKQCAGKCGLVKPITEFSMDRTRADLHMDRCKICVSEYQKEHKELESTKERNRNYNKEVRFADPWNKTIANIRTAVRQGLKRMDAVKDRRTLEILQIDDWKEALEHLGYFDEETHLDHIIPITAAEKGNQAELEELNQIWNLRRIPKELNKAKGYKLPEKRLLHPNLSPGAIEIYERELEAGRKVFDEKAFLQTNVPLTFVEE